MGRLWSKLTYANTVATLALFLALGGAGYAALKLPANSVGTRQLKKRAVTAAKVKPDSLTGAQIKESMLGTVPRARHALQADVVASKIDKAARGCAGGSEPNCIGTLVDLGAFKLRYECASTFALVVFADATGANANLNWFSITTFGGPFSQQIKSDGVAGGTNVLVFRIPPVSAGAHTSGTIVYRDDSQVITVPYEGWATVDVPTDTSACQVEGTVTRAT